MGGRTSIVIGGLAAVLALTSCSGDGPAETTPSTTSSPSADTRSPSAPVAWTQGLCLDVRVPKPDTQAAAPVDCALATAGVRITRLVAQGEGAAKCPRDSDGWLDAPGGSQTACVRNRVGPHPGDPGKGGGVLQVGDCTLVEDGVGGLKKTPCKGGKAWGKVVGHVSIEFECKRPADYSVTTDTKKYGVLPAPRPLPVRHLHPAVVTPDRRLGGEGTPDSLAP